MRVLCVVFVVVCVGHPCQGGLLHRGPTSFLRRTVPGLAPPEPGDPETFRELKGNDSIALKKYLRTVIKDKERKYKTSDERGGERNSSVPGVPHNLISKTGTKMGADRPGDGQTRLSESVPVSLTASKSPATPRRLLNPSMRQAESRAEGRRHPSRHLTPWTSHISPVDMPEVMPCRDPRRQVVDIATAPPNVCDLCPDEDGKNPLAPCTCVGIGGTSTGLISINCPSSIVSLDQLRDIFHNTNFLTTHVFQFTLQDSCVDGALTRDIWGDLDFKYVFINYNKITDVDNGAFIGSSDTLVGLNLANNEIKNYIAMYNDLPNLLSLNLRGNNISLIFSEDFTYPSLTDLDLSYNQITSIGTRSFAALKKLKKLNLSYNLLTSIGDERFTFIDHDFTNSLVINLSHNKISSISDTAFLDLHNVEIDLQYNQLHTLEKNVFYPIIIDSQYYAFFLFTGNQMVCDCSLQWVLQDGRILSSFDNFVCVNNGKHLYSLTMADLGNCSLAEEVSHS